MKFKCWIKRLAPSTISVGELEFGRKLFLEMIELRLELMSNSSIKWSNVAPIQSRRDNILNMQLKDQILLFNFYSSTPPSKLLI